MSDYLHKLHKMKLFSLQDAAKVAGNESTAKSLLSAGLRNGTVCRIKKNLYAVTDLATMRCAASKYEIASHITETSCVAYHSAMEYHGLPLPDGYVVPGRYDDFETIRGTSGLSVWVK